MKKNRLYILLVASMSVFVSSCSDFLDTVPDSRTEIDKGDKITTLLVSAYPDRSPFFMAEMSSDNVMDNGARFDDIKLQEEIYLWEDPTDRESSDCPYDLWESCYKAIASANQALKSIEELGDPDNLSAQKGEALVCRAYAHFVLANIFCMPYNPQTADKELGIPYCTTPEREVFAPYERGTLAQTYEQIEQDITKGLPLIRDAIYSIPKYHFNKKAANAFAARFYLFSQKWDKVIEHADAVLGSNPVTSLRHWTEDFGELSQVEDIASKYISEKVAANLLISPVYSEWAYIAGPYSIYERYAHGREIFSAETIDTNGPWSWRGGSGLLYFIGANQQKNPFPKMITYFEYTDKANGIGFNHAVNVTFNGDETLLCRAEAYAVGKHNYAQALADINQWIVYNSDMSQDTGSDLTISALNEYYDALPYAPAKIDSRDQRSVKKTLNPEGFTVAAGTEENLVQLILQLRRLGGIQEGIRWYDLKRYGIEFSHNHATSSSTVLKKDDPRRAIQLPQEVINAGMQPNPRNN